MIRLHDLRHTAASRMLMGGIDRFTVAKMLGHSPQVLDTIYAHWLDEDDNLMDRLRPATRPASATVHRLA